MTNKLKVKNFRYLFKLVFKITKWHVDSISKKTYYKEEVDYSL